MKQEMFLIYADFCLVQFWGTWVSASRPSICVKKEAVKFNQGEGSSYARLSRKIFEKNRVEKFAGTLKRLSCSRSCFLAARGTAFINNGARSAQFAELGLWI
jgi:hypothetical protein